MSITNALGSVPVKDLCAAVAWQERLVGRPLGAKPMAEVAEWLFEPGGAPRVHMIVERAGSGSFTLVVTTLADQLSAFAAPGLGAGPEMTDEAAAVVIIKDRHANSITFAESIGRLRVSAFRRSDEFR